MPFTRAGFKPLRVLATKLTWARRLRSACEIHDLEAMRVRDKVTCGVYAVESRGWWADVFTAHHNLRRNIKLILPRGVRKLYSWAYFGAIYLGSESFAPDRGPLANHGPSVDEDEPGVLPR